MINFQHILTRAGICSFTHFTHFTHFNRATVSDSLRSLKTNERLWANRSGRSRQMSNHEQIAQVAHDSWATVSNLLRWWGMWVNRSPKWAMWANCSGRLQKMSNHKRFAQVAYQTWATMSESLRLLTNNEQMSESLICSFFRKKTSDLLRKPLSEFPALILTNCQHLTGIFQNIISAFVTLLSIFRIHFKWGVDK